MLLGVFNTVQMPAKLWGNPPRHSIESVRRRGKMLKTQNKGKVKNTNSNVKDGYWNPGTIPLNKISGNNAIAEEDYDEMYRQGYNEGYGNGYGEGYGNRKPPNRRSKRNPESRYASFSFYYEFFRYVIIY